MFGFKEKDSNLKIENAVYNEVLEAGLGWIHKLHKGQTFRILDIEGNQAVDTTFYDLTNLEDQLQRRTNYCNAEKHISYDRQYSQS